MSSFLTSFKSHINQVVQFEQPNETYNAYSTPTEFNNIFKDLSNDSIELSVIHINIRSLNANITKLQQLLFELNLNIEVVVLSEVWTTNVSFYCNALPDYNFIYELPADSKVGGVGMFITKKIDFKTRDEFKILGDKYKIESLFVEVTKNGSNYLIGGIYRHPNSNILLFKEDMDFLLQKINSNKQ